MFSIWPSEAAPAAPKANDYTDSQRINALVQIIVKFFRDYPDAAIPAAHFVADNLHKQFSGQHPQQGYIAKAFNWAWSSQDPHQVEALHLCEQELARLMNQAIFRRGDFGLVALTTLLGSSNSRNWSPAEYGVGNPSLNNRFIRDLFGMIRVQYPTTQPPDAETEAQESVRLLELHVLLLNNEDIVALLGKYEHNSYVNGERLLLGLRTELPDAELSLPQRVDTSAHVPSLWWRS